MIWQGRRSWSERGKRRWVEAMVCHGFMAVVRQVEAAVVVVMTPTYMWIVMIGNVVGIWMRFFWEVG